MGIKRKYLTTVHTKENDVVLVAQYTGNIVETYCQGYWVKNKKIRMPKFDAFYYNSELIAL